MPPSSLVSRLEKQLALAETREAELLEANRRLITEVGDKDTTQKKIDNANAEKEKVAELWETVKAQYAEIDKSKVEAEAEDRVLRKELSVTLGAKLNAMSESSDVITQRRSDALHANEELKRKLDIVDKSSGEREKINGFFIEQQKSTEKAQARLAADIEAIPQLQKEVEEIRVLYQQQQDECMELAQEAKKSSETFNSVEKEVTKCHNQLKADDAARKRIMTKMTGAQQEVNAASKRLQGSMKERDQEILTLEKHTNQFKTIMAQIEKLQALTETLSAQPATQHQDPAKDVA